ncbi:hypothetical protein ACLKA6_008251 [Drosophila palustris]
MRKGARTLKAVNVCVSIHVCAAWLRFPCQLFKQGQGKAQLQHQHQCKDHDQGKDHGIMEPGNCLVISLQWSFIW